MLSVAVLVVPGWSRDDYIAEMQVVYGDSEPLPEGRGWELVKRCASGSEANLNKVRWGLPTKQTSCDFAACLGSFVLRQRLKARRTEH